MSEDLALRKQTLEVLGWKIETSFRQGWRYWLVDPSGTDILSSNLELSDVVGRMPPIDTDPGIAIQEMGKFCDARNLTWLLAQNQDGSHRCVFYDRRGHRHRRPAKARAVGATPAEAICKAMIAASKGEG